jgi:hypothetical protein
VSSGPKALITFSGVPTASIVALSPIAVQQPMRINQYSQAVSGQEQSIK